MSVWSANWPIDTGTVHAGIHPDTRSPIPCDSWNSVNPKEPKEWNPKSQGEDSGMVGATP